jgi:hypothetical protein
MYINSQADQGPSERLGRTGQSTPSLSGLVPLPRTHAHFRFPRRPRLQVHRRHLRHCVCPLDRDRRCRASPATAHAAEALQTDVRQDYAIQAGTVTTWLTNIHMVTVGGRPVRLLISVTGLVVATLSITGF